MPIHLLNEVNSANLLGSWLNFYFLLVLLCLWGCGGVGGGGWGGSGALIWTHTHTHTHLHHQQHSPFCVRNIHQIRDWTRFPPRAAHLFPPQCIESKCFSLWVLCGHMSVSSSHRLRLCSLLQEMLGLVSAESNRDRRFKECRENKQVCRCWALHRQACDK